MKLAKIILIGWIFVILLGRALAIDGDKDGFYAGKDFLEALKSLPVSAGKVSSGSECGARSAYGGINLQFAHGLSSRPNVAIAWILNSWEYCCGDGCGECFNADVSKVTWDQTNVYLVYSNNGYWCDFSDIHWKAGVLGYDCDDTNKNIYPGAQELCDNNLYNCDNKNYIQYLTIEKFPRRGGSGGCGDTLIEECPSGYVITGFKYVPYQNVVFNGIWPRCTKLDVQNNQVVLSNSFYWEDPGNYNTVTCLDGYVLVGMNYKADSAIRAFQPICQKIGFSNNNIVLTDLDTRAFVDPAKNSAYVVKQDLCPQGSAVIASELRGCIWTDSFGGFTCTEIKYHAAEKTYDEVCTPESSETACVKAGGKWKAAGWLGDITQKCCGNDAEENPKTNVCCDQKSDCESDTKCIPDKTCSTLGYCDNGATKNVDNSPSTACEACVGKNNWLKSGELSIHGDYKTCSINRNYQWICNFFAGPSCCGDDANEYPGTPCSDGPSRCCKNSGMKIANSGEDKWQCVSTCCTEECTGPTEHKFEEKNTVTAKLESCVTQTYQDKCVTYDLNNPNNPNVGYLEDYSCNSNKGVDGPLYKNCAVLNRCDAEKNAYLSYSCSDSRCVSSSSDITQNPGSCVKCSRFWKLFFVADDGNLDNAKLQIINSLTDDQKKGCCPNAGDCFFNGKCYTKDTAFDITGDGKNDLICR